MEQMNLNQLRDKVLHFVEKECYPAEKELKKLGEIGMDLNNEKASKIIKTLQISAKKQGLWALGHPKAIGGQGMPFKDYVYVNEIQGRSELAPIALGTHSLQDSLMMYNYGSDEIKAKYLDKLVSAEIYPSFAMTEPSVSF